ITATGCGTGTTLEWATSASGPWSTTTPTYTTSPITVYARCVDDVTGCVSSVASATTNPTNCSSPGDCENMFISEYIEGTSNNKAVEIYNPTSSPINLSGGYIHIYHNGSSTPTASIALSGTIMPFGTFVVASTLADPTLQGMADMLAVTLLFDGDDAIALEYNNSILDVLGQIGFDPGSQWGGPGLRTKDQTLRRKSTVQQGDSDGSDAFDPADEWDPYPVNTFNGLGLHLSRCECDVMVVNITGDAQICQGDSTTLTASGGSTYLWSTGDTVAIINVIPTTTSTYVVTATSVNGCTGTAFIEVTVNDLPAAPVITITDNVCPSTDGTIAAAGCGPGTILEWSHYPTGPWSTTTPNYALFSIPVYARCVDTLTGCISPIANETTNVESCTIIGDCESMFISEYVEGTSNNKAIEIYNPTSSTINLSGGYIKLYTNGSWTPTKIITLSGSIPPFESFVVASTLANPSLQALADMLDAGLLYDGDDAIVLEYNNTILDVFGQIGFDPGSQWGGPGLRTKDQTLRRKSTVQKGDTNGLDAFDPAIEWDPQPVNTFDGLGEHISECDCPGLTVAPENVTITNSSCTDCVVDGGVIIAPVAPCPGGSDLEYSTDGGVTWTTDLPVYNQEGPAQTIITRCVCEKDPTMVSPSSAAVTTVPGECPLSCFYTFEITDPCSCNNDATVAGNDGTFDEVITVTGPTGHIITASVTGGTPTSITFTESTPGVYVSIPFQHIDNIGYTALIYADGILIGPISNKCAYPDVAIDITGPIENCLNSDDIPLTATISGDDGSGTYVWSGTGVTGNVFNPSGLPVGSITISLSYTGVNNGNISPDGGITPAYPGCIQPAEKSVDIIEGAPAPDIDDIEVCEGESTLIIAGVSGSIDTTNTFTWDFEAGITGPGVSEDLTIADNGPTQSVGSGVNGVIAQGAGAGCTAAISGTGFDDVDFATAVAEDKYFEFCVGTPQSGIIFDGVSAVNWIHRKSNSGPVNWALVSDSDINTPLLTGMLGNNNCTSAGGAITLNTDGCYRLYYWGASGASGTLRVSEMVITANYQVPTGVFNFYNVDPVSNPGATPVAMGTSYDPGTTPSSSPDTIWVTVVEGGCESLPTEVVVTVHANPTLDVMQPDAKCEGDSFDIADVVLTPSPTGGTFSYYASLSDAETETNPITSGLDNITSNLTVFVRYELPTGCYVIEQINFVFNALPPAPDVPSELNVCTGESTLITVNDGPINVVTNWGFESGLTENGISEDPSVTSDGPVHTLGSGVGSPVHQSAGSGCSNAISMSGFDPANTTLAQAIAANQYIEFCLGTTQPGYTFDGVTSIDWEHRASNSGPLSWALLASTDLGTTILSGTISGGGSCKVGGGAISINTNTCYRIYYWNASSALGNVRIDNFAITAQYSSGATYNWYNVDPATNPGATPVATGNSYDPGTTAFTSPDEIWVTAILNGCEGPASKITVNVGITPTINDVADQEHCAGALTDAIDFTGTPADSMIVFNWTNDNTSIGLAASGTGDIPSFVTINNGSTTQVATITVTPSLTVNGVTCSNDSITFTITVHPTPTVSISIEDTSGNLDNDGEICEGDSATLTASGATSYVWNTGATTPSITVTAGGVYTVTGQNAQGCSATASVTIMVHPVPTPSITVTENSLIPNDGTVIEGAPATLTATGGGSYLWNTGATTPSITVVNNVSGTYTYTVTVTNEFGCTAIASQDIIVIPPPCNLVCSGNQQITLAPGNCEYQLPNLVTLAGICEIYEIVQISGPTAGSFIAPGTYELKWELRRRSNGEVMDECTTTVTVVGYPNPSRTLACNNHIYISADDHCEVTLYADMFLEGGPYGCYWNYQLIVDGQAIPQGEGLALGLGKHTYEVVDPVTGNRCWGTFTVEDKLPPVVECNCSSEPADVSGFTEIGRFGGKIYYLSNNNYTWTGAYAHATSVNGTMLSIGSADENTFIVNAMRNAGYTTDFRIWIGLTDDENYGGTEAGSNQVNGWVWASGEPVNYTNWNNGEPNNSGNEDYVEMFGNLTNPGVWNDSNNNRSQRYIMEVEDCSFKCYEFDVVSEETVSKLFDPNYKYKLTTPPTATDACGPVNGTFTDEIINHGACGSKRILRHWTFTDAAGWTATCTQIFTFNPISVEDLTPPAALVTLSCGEDTSPAAVAAFKDVDSRTGGPSANNVGAFYDDYGQTPSIIELQEGHPYGYFTYPHIGWDGEDHLQKVDPSVCNIYVSYTDVN
ncbi:MAG: lamin tail domain-containing protein, partial [Saprospiraceae bacterium]|nr:lamin tail domain-containing protein [Saprospiraceae bacterium]